jgi:hypothetical protein
MEMLKSTMYMFYDLVSARKLLTRCQMKINVPDSSSVPLTAAISSNLTQIVTEKRQQIIVLK